MSIAIADATQFAPVKIYPDPIVAGDIKIDAGAQIMFFIPTEIAPGLLLLQATFSSSTTPPTKVAASVAQWPLPPGS